MLTPHAQDHLLAWTLITVAWLSVIVAVAKQWLDHVAGEHEAARTEQAKPGTDAWFADLPEWEKRAGAERLLEAVKTCHPRCDLGPREDHPGYLGYRCIDASGRSLPWPDENGGTS